jgi:hypothetical protein
LNKNVRNTIISFIITFAIAAFLFAVTANDNNGLGPYFALSIYYIYIIGINILIGFTAIIIHKFIYTKLQYLLIFNFVGTINVIAGSLGYILYALNSITEKIFLVSLGMNILIGVFILYKIYKEKRVML